MEAIMVHKSFSEAYPEGRMRTMFRDRFVATFPALLADLLDRKVTRQVYAAARLRIWQRMAQDGLWCDFLRAAHEEGVSTEQPLEVMQRNARQGIAAEIENIECTIALLDVPGGATAASKSECLMLYAFAVQRGVDLESMTLREVLEQMPVNLIV